MLPDPLFLNVHMYGVMIALGLLAGFLVLWLYCQKRGIDAAFSDFLFYNGIVAIFLGFLSAALFQSFYNYLAHPENGFHLGGGITFIGGLIGGAAAFLIGYAIFRPRLKGRLGQALSIIPCVILIAHAFGRVGCFFAGCCHGRVTDSIFGVRFPRHAYAVYPTQLYEAIFLFLMFALSSYLLLRHHTRHNMSLYLFSYGVFRFLIEFLRGDARGSLVTGLSPSQFWSLLMVPLAFVVWFLEKRYVPREKTEQAPPSAE